MVLELLATAIFVGLMLRGKLMRLADVKLRFGWMIFVPVALHLAAVRLNFAHVFDNSSWVFALLHVTQFALFMTVMIANRHIPGAKLMFVGLAVNLLAIIANGGYMPVSSDAIAAVYGKAYLHHIPSEYLVRHAVSDAGARLVVLCDVIGARRPFVLFPAVYSIGDLITSVGCMLAIVKIMRTPVAAEKRALSEV